MTTTAPTYFRPINADTGQPTLAAYFTAPLCNLECAYQHNLEDRVQEFAGDVRDHLDQLGIPIRPTIAQGRVRIVQEVDDDEEFASPPVVIATVMVFFTDAEPDDPRLAALASGFRSKALDTDVEFSIPTAESEAELEASIAAGKIRGAAYVAREEATADAAPAATAGVPDTMPDEVLDDLFG